MKPKETLKDWCLRHNAYLLLHFYEQGNNEEPPEKIGFSAGKKVDWACSVCGVSWTAAPNKVTKYRKLDCPYCNHRKPAPFYNLETEYPELAAQFDEKANGKLACQYLPTSHSRVQWKCDKNHKWSAVICERVGSAEYARKTNTPLCPYCSGKKASATCNLTTECRELLAEWDYEKNNGRKPEEFSVASNQKVHWKCLFNQAHRWEAKISNRTLLHRGCPACAKEFKISYPARTLFFYLQQAVSDCECEVPFQNKYKIDIVLPLSECKIAIEHDGFYFHDNPKSQKRAVKKYKILEAAGYKMLRIRDSKEVSEVFTEHEGAVVYPFEERYKYLDAMIFHVFHMLNLPLPDIDHWRDYYKINQLYFIERKKHTLAIEYPELAKEWSKNNPFGSDTVASKSARRVLWTCPYCNRDYPAIIANRVRNGSKCPYCGPTKTKVCEENSLARKFPEVSKEWHYALNAPLTPRDILPGADKRFFWRCAKGHVWEAPAYARTGPRKHGCPMCSHHSASEETCLQTLNPELSRFWHYEKNAPLTPEDVTAQSNKRLWWVCQKGHTWKQSVNVMSKLSPEKFCPFCSNRQVCKDNSLAFRNPKLVAEWDDEQNAPLTLEQVLFDSKKQVWWRRGELVWRDSVYNRNLKGQNMPPKTKKNVHQIYSLATVNPKLAAQWNAEKNGTLTPKDVSANSGKNIWWKCPQCENEWETTVAKRNGRGDGCPYCSRRRVSPEYCLATQNPALAAQWHPFKNGNLRAQDVLPVSAKKVWWKCPQCENEWKATISNRSKGRGCPKCAVQSQPLGSLAQERPQLLLEWDYKKNTVRPTDCPARSNKKYWWKCIVCGYEWEVSPDSRFYGSGCPSCVKKK